MPARSTLSVQKKRAALIIQTQWVRRTRMMMNAFDAQDNAHVALLIAWWGALSDTDRTNLFHPRLYKLAPFLDFFCNYQAELMFVADANGLWLCAWTSPYYEGAEFSLWVRPDIRRNIRPAHKAWQCLQLAYEAALTKYPVLFGQTRQSALHAEHLKMGYRYAGKLEHAFKETPIWLYELTREDWQNRHKAAADLRHKRREARHRGHEWVRGHVEPQQQQSDRPSNRTAEWPVERTAERLEPTAQHPVVDGHFERNSNRNHLGDPNRDQLDDEPIRGTAGELGTGDRRDRPEDHQNGGSADAGSAQDWRRQFFHPVDNEES